MYYTLVEDFLKENKKNLVFFCILLILIQPVEGVMLPQLYSNFFEKLKDGGKLLTTNINNINQNISTQTAAEILVIVGLVWIFIIVLSYIKNESESYLLPSILSHIRKFMFQKYINKNSDDFKETKQGETIARILEVSHSIKDIFAITCVDFLPCSLTLIIGIVAITKISKQIGYVILLFVFLHVFIDVLLFPRLIRESIKKQEIFMQNTQNYTNDFSNLLSIYINNQEENVVNKNNQNENLYTKQFSLLWKISNNIRLIGSVISVVMFITVLWILLNMRTKNKIGVPEITSITIILLYFISNLRRMHDQVPRGISLLGTVEQSRDFIENIIKANDDEIDQETDTYDSIKISNLSFKYGEKTVLEDVNLEVKPQEKVALIGPSGSGKTTLMKLLLKLHKIPKDAKIMIGDQNINELSRSSLRKHITYINQRTTLFETSILENMMFGNYASEEEVIALLKKYDLQNLFDKVGGIHASAGVSGANLSLGMQKVTIIIRGILRDSPIVLIDEPLAGLDAKTRTKILNLLRKECQEKTMIIVTHDKEVYDVVDRVVDIKSL